MKNLRNDSVLVHYDKVNFSFTNEKVLEEVDWCVSSGDFWAILGPNGGGKTTLAKLLVGLLRPSSGEIFRAKNLSFGFVPQDSFKNLAFPATASDIVQMGFLGHSMQKFNSIKSKSLKSQKELSRRLLAHLGVDSLANAKIGELSGGQRQRVLIARALASSANILVLDEPTASVDIKSREKIYRILRDFVAGADFLDCDYSDSIESKNIESKNIESEFVKIDSIESKSIESSKKPKRAVVMINHDISALSSGCNKILHINRIATLHEVPKIGALNGANDGHFCEIDALNALV